ncbi:MAG: hypothetical protein AABX02_02505 [archaeon]
MNLGKRGQSALEYLMTYGWALVVIVIAVAALVVLINPNTIQGDQCDAKFGPFTVSQSDVNVNATTLVLVNQTGQSVTFTGATISGTYPGNTTFATNVSITPIGSGTTMSANETDTVILPHPSALSTPGSNSYNFTYNLTYTAGQLAGVSASGNCRGQI